MEFAQYTPYTIAAVKASDLPAKAVPPESQLAAHGIGFGLSSPASLPSHNNNFGRQTIKFLGRRALLGPVSEVLPSLAFLERSQARLQSGQVAQKEAYILQGALNANSVG